MVNGSPNQGRLPCRACIAPYENILTTKSIPRIIMLIELVYCSVASRVMSTEDLHGLLDHARKKNASLGVTGILLYGEKTREFIQLLEGEDDCIEALLSVITADDRHSSVDVMYQGPIKERSFADWSMAFRTLDEIAPSIQALQDVRADTTEGYLTFNAESLPAKMQSGRASRAKTMLAELSKSL